MPRLNMFRPKTQDPDGAWVVCEGDFVVFDGEDEHAGPGHALAVTRFDAFSCHSPALVFV
jgi:hypothetical protein